MNSSSLIQGGEPLIGPTFATLVEVITAAKSLREQWPCHTWTVLHKTQVTSKSMEV